MSSRDETYIGSEVAIDHARELGFEYEKSRSHLGIRLGIPEEIPSNIRSRYKEYGHKGFILTIFLQNGKIWKIVKKRSMNIDGKETNSTIESFPDS